MAAPVSGWPLPKPWSRPELGCIVWGGAVRLSPADDVIIGVERVLDIDAVGPVRMIHHFLPSMLLRDATIINVSSGLAYLPYSKAPIYSAAKGFVHFYTLCLREQLRGTSVRVVELLPPIVDTAMAAGVKFPIPPMPPAKLVAALMQGLRRGKTEIAPGTSVLLKWMGRLLPQFGLRQMTKS